MSKHLLRDLERLKKEILTMGSLVEEALDKSTTALIDRRADLAEEVIVGDREIDEREVEVEEDCLKMLALHQPVAADLRFIVAVMKVNNDLERMGDHAKNIAKRAVSLSKRDPIPVDLPFRELVQKVRAMVRMSLDSLINLDSKLARLVRGEDEYVDDLNRQVHTVLQAHMQQFPSIIEQALYAISASRQLERIADLATNVAEDVVFLVEGELIRHQFANYRRQGGDAS